ncbi:MAG: hypothetical protein VB067_05260 [Christensenellaceae bacterium]|nr:hypothetical protein [Christensenellaceae bacterium]MEA5068374.1 hypothetical protein [Christensenellaceae bacterium]
MRIELRERARRCLMPEALLRADRGEALYVTDCVDAASALEAAGFRTTPRGALLAISPGRAMIEALERQYPPPDDALYRQLGRLRGRPVSDAELALLASALKRLEIGGRADPDFERKLRQTAAACLRTGNGGALALCRSIQIVSKEEPI